MPSTTALSGERAQGRPELIADGAIHVLGITAGLIGSAVLIAMAGLRGQSAELVVVLVYASGLLAMLVCSATYNMARASRRRALLRRLDHAAIFMMIAGTYTPFTVLELKGPWSVGLTAAVWSVAALGIVAKLWRPAWLASLSIPLYVALGWTALIALDPLLRALGTPTLILLFVGGSLYSVGVVFHVWRRLPFQNAIWHGFVLAGASVHYAALANEMMR